MENSDPPDELKSQEGSKAASNLADFLRDLDPEKIAQERHITNDELQEMFESENQEGLTREIYAGLYSRDITFVELSRLLGRYPFLEIRNPLVPESQYLDRKPTITHTAMGWVVFDRGDHLLIGPGRLAYGSYGKMSSKDDEEGSGGAEIHGTINYQGVLSTEEVMRTALERWQEVEWVSGYFTISRVAWMICQDENRELMSYPVNEEDLLVYRYLKSIYGGSKISQRLQRKQPAQSLRVQRMQPE